MPGSIIRFRGECRPYFVIIVRNTTGEFHSTNYLTFFVLFKKVASHEKVENESYIIHGGSTLEYTTTDMD